MTQIHQVLPRLMSQFDTNPLSATLGQGDRQYWAWKTIDFGNATYQGAVNGLSKLVAADALPPGWSADKMCARIDQMIGAIEQVRSADGSLSEAYPNESSFCVTGLILYDLMVAIDTLGTHTGQREVWLAQADPLVHFLENAEETHGEITNHIAAAAAGLARYDRARGRGYAARTDTLIARILAMQSNEGWFSEYGGADGGYQSLALSYLADLHETRPDAALEPALRRCLDFLRHFCCPDGSFGGYVGWRGTRFIAPGGLEALAKLSVPAAQIAAFARAAIARQTVPTLNVFDAPNLPVFFNVWVQAALACCDDAAQNSVGEQDSVPLPARTDGVLHFEEAGLVVRSQGTQYTLVNAAKGGVLRHFEEGREVMSSGGVLARDDQGRVLTSQSLSTQVKTCLETDETGTQVRIEAPLVPISGRRPTPIEFAVLRVLAVTMFRFRWINELFKNIAVKLLIKAAPRAPVQAVRMIHFDGGCRIEDSVAPGSGVHLDDGPPQNFSAMHMANQGFWQIGDEGR
jgi:hypothetical protein